MHASSYALITHCEAPEKSWLDEKLLHNIERIK